MPDFVVKDSGQREKFDTGAVRDIRAGKGRYDLVSPLAMRRLANAYGGRYDLISPKAMKRLARIYEAGAIKYSPRNWEAGMNISRLLDSALRHTFQYLDGMRDEDHLAQASWNLFAAMFYEEMVKRGKLPASLLDTMDYTNAAGGKSECARKDALRMDSALWHIYRYIEGARDYDHLAYAAKHLFETIHNEELKEESCTTSSKPSTD